MPEVRSLTATREGHAVHGAPFKRLRPPARATLGQRRTRLRPRMIVRTARKPRPLRELPPAMKVGHARGGAGADKVEFPAYETSTSVVRTLGNAAADMSGADSERDAVMMCFNWSCDVSKDGGASWKRLDPSTVFPNTLGGGFWCDQIVIYVPSVDLFVWFLQYYADAAGQGAFRIAVASSGSVAADPTAWTYWDFVAGDFGKATSDTDYPDLAYSKTMLYAATDIMGAGRVFLRMPLKELKAGGTVHFDYTDPDDGGLAWGCHLVQQTDDQMMWAAHEDSSTVRFFQWADGSGTYSWESVAVAAWPNGTLSSTGPDGNDWLTKLRDFPGNAITGGVQLSSGRVALAWTASSGQAKGQGKDFKQAHIRYVEIDPATRTTTREIPIWNDDYAFAYPSLARAGNDVGIVLGWGGPSDNSNCAMGFMGDFVVWFIDASTRSVTRFGDYLTARPSQRGGGCSAFGYWMESVAADANQVNCHPFFTRFRRP